VNIIKQAVGDTGMKPCIVLGGFYMFEALQREVESTVSQLAGRGWRGSTRYTAAGMA